MSERCSSPSVNGCKREACPSLGRRSGEGGAELFEGGDFGPFLDVLKLCHSSAFQKALSGFGVDRFSGEAVLNGECVRHHTFENGIFQQFGVDLGFHAASLQEIVAGGNAWVPGHQGRGRWGSIG